MTDPVAEAAAQIAAQQPAEPTLLEAAMTTIHDLEAKVEHLIHPDAVSVGIESKPSLESAPVTTLAPAPEPVTGNVLVNAAPVFEAPVIMPAIVEAAPAAVEPLPRESHLMLLEAKVAGFRAKLANAERVSLAEFEAIVGHVKAVL